MNIITEEFEKGLRVVSLSTLDTDIVIPREIDGKKVLSLGDRFLLSAHGTGTRTLTIPSTVTDVSSDAFAGSSGITEIDFDGELEAFCKFNITLENECTLKCMYEGRKFEFTFPCKCVMSFPDFDNMILSSNIGLGEDLVMTRLSDPAMLTDENRKQYTSYIREHIMPRAERAAATGNVSDLVRINSTGVLDAYNLKILLEKSIESGKTAATSAIMSMIRESYLNEKTLRHGGGE